MTELHFILDVAAPSGMKPPVAGPVDFVCLTLLLRRQDEFFQVQKRGRVAVGQRPGAAASVSTRAPYPEGRSPRDKQDYERSTVSRPAFRLAACRSAAGIGSSVRTDVALSCAVELEQQTYQHGGDETTPVQLDAAASASERAARRWRWHR